MAYLSLTYEQMQELKQTSRTAIGRVALRALMVLWRAEGLTTIQIAGLLGCERQSITCWIDRYLALGVSGLYDEPRSGRPRHIDSDTVDDIEAALDDPPQDEDGLPIRWTLSRLRACFLTRARRAFGIETLRRAIHKRGFRWKRPRLWATGEDPESFEKQLLNKASPPQAAGYLPVFTFGRSTPQAAGMLYLAQGPPADNAAVSADPSTASQSGREDLGRPQKRGVGQSQL